MPFKPGMLESGGIKYNEDITFYSVLTFPKPPCDNVLQPKPPLSHKGLANVNTRKRMFYPLIKVYGNLLLVLDCISDECILSIYLITLSLF